MTEGPEQETEAAAEAEAVLDSEPVADPAQLGLGEETILGGAGPRHDAGEEYIELAQPPGDIEKK